MCGIDFVSAPYLDQHGFAFLPGVSQNAAIIVMIVNNNQHDFNCSDLSYHNIQNCQETPYKSTCKSCSICNKWMG